MRTILIALSMALAGAGVSGQTSMWEPMNRGLAHTLVYSIAMDPVDSLTMYCGTDFGRLYKSTDGGFNWILHNNGIPPEYRNERVTALLMHPADRSILYAGFSGRESVKNLFRSTDAGMSWEVINTPNDWRAGGILHIHHAGGSSNRLYVGLGWWHGLYFSDDGGQSWTPSNTDAGIQCIAGHSAQPFVILAGCADDKILLRSLDAGSTWQKSLDGIDGHGKSTGVRALAFDPSNPNIAYAGVTAAPAGLHRSTNAGRSWSKLNSVGEISEISIHPKNPRLVYISAIGTGVHRSTDGGSSWQLISDGLPTTDVMRVRIAPGYPVRVFAVTLEHGIYRMVDEELSEDLFAD